MVGGRHCLVSRGKPGSEAPGNTQKRLVYLWKRQFMGLACQGNKEEWPDQHTLQLSLPLSFFYSLGKL